MSIKKDSQSLNQAGDESYSKSHSNVWVNFKQLQLNQDDKSVLTNGQWLNDNQFPKLNSLMSSLLQLSKLLPNSTNALQVINTGRSHWALISL